MAMSFFTRIDFMTLEPCNKTAGFLFNVATPAMQALCTVPVDAAAWQLLVDEARKRLRRSGVISEELVSDCGMAQFEGTAIPRSFWVGMQFAASLGAELGELSELLDLELAPYLPPELAYSPHNVDSPAHALGLMILVQTWAEWAWGKLLVAEALQAKAVGSHEDNAAAAKPAWLGQVHAVEVSPAVASSHSEVGAVLSAVADAMAQQANDAVPTSSFAEHVRQVFGEAPAAQARVAAIGAEIIRSKAFDIYGYGSTNYTASRARGWLYNFVFQFEEQSDGVTAVEAERGLVGLFELYPAIVDVSRRAPGEPLPGLNGLLDVPAEPLSYLVNAVLRNNLQVGNNSLLVCSPGTEVISLVRPDGRATTGLSWTPLVECGNPATLRGQFELIYQALDAAKKHLQ